MPHFILDCSENVLKWHSPQHIMETVYSAAESTNLFAKNDIKVRIRTFEHYQLGEDKNGFIHVFCYILQGRTAGQKAELSKVIISELNALFPELSILSMNVMDFERASYTNKSLI